MILFVGEVDLAVVAAIDGMEEEAIVIGPQWSSHEREFGRERWRTQGKDELTPDSLREKWQTQGKDELTPDSLPDVIHGPVATTDAFGSWTPNRLLPDQYVFKTIASAANLKPVAILTVG